MSSGRGGITPRCPQRELLKAVSWHVGTLLLPGASSTRLLSGWSREESDDGTCLPHPQCTHEGLSWRSSHWAVQEVLRMPVVWGTKPSPLTGSRPIMIWMPSTSLLPLRPHPRGGSLCNAWPPNPSRLCFPEDLDSIHMIASVQLCRKSLRYKPSSYELSKVQTCGPSVSGVSDAAAGPASPVADDPLALPSPPPLPPPSTKHSSCLFTDASPLYFSRRRTFQG